MSSKIIAQNIVQQTMGERLMSVFFYCMSKGFGSYYTSGVEKYELLAEASNQVVGIINDISIIVGYSRSVVESSIYNFPSRGEYLS